MKTEFRKSFEKDLKKIKDYNLLKKIKLVIEEIENAENLQQINNLKALKQHQESIEILDKIGAKCDLAEAYFQLALTYQAMEDKINSKTYFDEALYLWGKEQIDAPKQIERVLKAMDIKP